MIPCYDVLERVAKFGMISVIDFYIKTKTFTLEIPYTNEESNHPTYYCYLSYIVLL